MQAPRPSWPGTSPGMPGDEVGVVTEDAEAVQLALTEACANVRLSFDDSVPARRLMLQALGISPDA